MAARMGYNPESCQIASLELALLLDAPTKGVWLSEATAIQLSRAFGTSASLWMKLDRTWQQHAQNLSRDNTPSNDSTDATLTEK